jgi:hypothetical protein
MLGRLRFDGWHLRDLKSLWVIIGGTREALPAVLAVLGVVVFDMVRLVGRQ